MTKQNNFNELVLLKGRATSPTLDEAISEYLGVNFCSRELNDFPDGEVHCHIKQNVRGKDCFVINSICRTSSQPVDKSLIELLVVIDTLKRASADRITAVVPYFGYGRQDRKPEGRVPITAKMVADLITGVGADRVLTVDLHAGQIQGFFDIPVDNLIPNQKVIIPAVRNLIKEEVNCEKEVKFGAPDIGSAARTDKIARDFNADLVIIYKRRKGAEQTEVRKVIGKVENSNIILIDDIASTVGTLVKAAEAIKEKGASDVWAAVTHGIFADPAMDRIKQGHLERILTTDTIPSLQKTRNASCIKYIGIGEMLGEAIEKIHKSDSVSEVIDHT